MLERFISLLERLVVAQEAQAEAAKNMLPIPMPAPSSESMPVYPFAPSVPPPAEPVASSDWNPLAEKPMGRYTKEKTAILDAMLAERGIDAAKMKTGQEKHSALLKWEEDKAAAPPDAGTPSTAGAQTAPAAGQAAAAPAAEPVTSPGVTLEECRKLATDIHAAGKFSVKEITENWKKVNGGVNPKDTPENLLPAVKAALLAMLGGGTGEDGGWD